MPHPHPHTSVAVATAGTSAVLPADRDVRLAADLKETRPVIAMNRRNMREALEKLKKPKK